MKKLVLDEITRDGNLWLQERYEYDAEGALVSRSTGQRIGFECNGARFVQLLGHRFPLKKVLWLYHFGEWPEGYIKHRNGDKKDFRIENLYSPSEQGTITIRPTKSGFFVYYGDKLVQRCAGIDEAAELIKGLAYALEI